MALQHSDIMIELMQATIGWEPRAVRLPVPSTLGSQEMIDLMRLAGYEFRIRQFGTGQFCADLYKDEKRLCALYNLRYTKEECVADAFSLYLEEQECLM
jgi:hypothetical protein